MNCRYALLTLPLFLSGCVVHLGPGSCTGADYVTEETLELTASDLSRLKVMAEAGDIRIEGEPGRDTIRVDAKIYQSEPGANEHDFRLLSDGNTAHLYATQSYSAGCWSNTPRIDMVVKVPAEMALDLEDGSGELVILGMAGTLNVVDGSGDLTIDGGQELVLNDGSGDARISNIQGNVEVDDGSGELWLSAIGGDLTLDDGSGDLSVQQVAGRVTIEDGSGDLSVEQVEGMVTVDDGSGDIQVRQTGGFNLIDGGSGGLSLEQVNGSVTLK
ncbi:DUF4097 family beta strand repeat-containing protein [Ferrimonas balearica]|uniref:DUF4097 family beta strand repeat-containing protein n=1 Tax=Ferrimonas balearica TaxID=44012 RepID=UPI001C9A0AF3|nr:DUF4097 family beta strand repeat-containing protein [Ferrimonas balearica]MBY5921647.1 DUF4097 domain-containing protein [Ferrimonas balearica]MBY5995013.1 DUF4097 domain-containing protein [Ferrimonas balearica]